MGFKHFTPTGLSKGCTHIHKNSTGAGSKKGQLGGERRIAHRFKSSQTFLLTTERKIQRFGRKGLRQVYWRQRVWVLVYILLDQVVLHTSNCEWSSQRHAPPSMRVVNGHMCAKINQLFHKNSDSESTWHTYISLITYTKVYGQTVTWTRIYTVLKINNKIIKRQD